MTYPGKFGIIASAFILAISFSIHSLHAAELHSQQIVSEKHQVVFQVSESDPKTWNLALNNVKNVQQDLGAKNVDVEVVVYGPGIGMLKLESPVANRIDEAVTSGVRVVACENTMKGLKMTRDDMLSSIEYVPAGVIELMNKQKAGYAYIRP